MSVIASSDVDIYILFTFLLILNHFTETSLQVWAVFDQCRIKEKAESALPVPF